MTGIPAWWPRDLHGKPLRYVYRAMRPDYRDLFPCDDRRLSPDKTEDQFRFDVVKACVEGSTTTSPFLHASTNYFATRKWHIFGHTRRHERAEDQKMVQIDMWGLYQDWMEKLISDPHRSRLCEFWIIDLSHQKATKTFFSKAPEKYGPYVAAQFAEFCTNVHSAKEVLLCWRGRINLNHFWVVDPMGAPLLGLRQCFVPLPGDRGRACLFGSNGML